MKNIGFLMDKSGTWSLAPAFDMTYAYNPGGLWTGHHQMSLNGKLENFAVADFAAAAGVEKIFVDGVRNGFPKFR